MSSAYTRVYAAIRIPDRENSYFTQWFMFEMNFVQVLQNFESKTKSSGFFQYCLENCRSGQYASEILNHKNATIY